MLARPEAATGVAPTLRAARREALGSVLPPKGPNRGSARPSTFDGECPDRGDHGESDGRNVAHGDGPRAASARTGEVPRGCRPDSPSSDDSEGLLRGDHAERSLSTLRCGLPPSPAPVRWCPVPIWPTLTTGGRGTGAHSSARAATHTNAHTRMPSVLEPRADAGVPPRLRGARPSPRSSLGPWSTFSFPHLAGQFQH